MKNYQRGQILLIVVLVMTIALTIGLSVATRTITNIRTTTDQENSQRAFSAAEAGMEKALQETAGTTGSLINSSSFQTSIATLSGVEILLNNGAPVLKDAPADLWLSTYPNYTNPWTGTLTVYWATASDNCDADESVNTKAALEIVLLSGAKANPIVDRFPVEPCVSRQAANNFELISAGGGTVAGKVFAYQKTIDVTSGLLLRIVPLYSSSLIAIKGCDSLGSNCTAFPAQGTLITSVGTANNTQTKLVAYKAYPTLPIQLFPFVIFSPR